MVLPQGQFLNVKTLADEIKNTLRSSSSHKLDQNTEKEKHIVKP